MSIRLFQICIFSFNIILLGAAWAEISDEKPTSVIISNNYISGIVGVVLKVDGSVVIGTDDEMHQFDAYEIPSKFLAAWNIDVEEAVEKFELTTEELLQKSLKKEQDQKAMVEDVKAKYPDINFPLVAKKNIFENETEIKQGEKFTLIPFTNELGEFYLKIVVLKTSGDWVVSIKKKGLTPINLGKIDVDINALSKDVEGWHKLAREGVNSSRLEYMRDPDGTIYTTTVANNFTRYYVETNFEKNLGSPSYVICFFSDQIDETFSIRFDRRKYIGDDDNYNFGKNMFGKKLLIFSSDGSIAYYRQ